MQTTISHDDGSNTPVWIIWATQSDCDDWNSGENLNEDRGDNVYTPGYYWAVCFPGCIPDSEFYGPFKTEEEAEAAAEEHLNY